MYRYILISTAKLIQKKEDKDMQRTVKVFNGAEIPTQAGFLKVTGWNVALLVYVDEYSIDEDGNEVYEGERRLTLEEIALEVKEVDGLNHKAEISEEE